MDIRFGSILFGAIMLAVVVGIAAAQSQSKNAQPAATPVVPTPMLQLQSTLVVQIVLRPSPQNAQPGCDLAAQSGSSVYCPHKLTAHVGDTIGWVNWDTRPHTVIADNGSFQSPVLADTEGRPASKTIRGQVYLHKFTKVGTYAYSDYLDPDMHGEIIIKP